MIKGNFKKIYARSLILIAITTLCVMSSCIKRVWFAPSVGKVVVSEITFNSVKCFCELIKDGGLSINKIGICWNTSPNPTISNFKIEIQGGNTLTTNINDLSPGTTYYIRGFASNESGISYGSQVQITTLATNPIVFTNYISSITSTTAISGGSISSDGGSNIIAKGVCWSNAIDPTIENSKTSDGAGIDNFTSLITGLVPGIQYYVRAYATNSVGTGYGSNVGLTTTAELPTITTISPTSITSTSATSGGNITSDGGAGVTVRGVCWSTSQNPTIANSKTEDGNGTGNYISAITGLTPGVQYNVRAYATNSKGTAYGDNFSFVTLSSPTLTTTPVSSITSISASSGGNISSDGGAPVTVRGVCWSTSQNPTIANSKTTDGNGVGPFTSILTGLSPGVLYYVRAYATNSIGTGYGFNVSFTSAVTLPAITTTSVTSITLNSATSGGNITSDGGSPVTARGVCWSTSQNPTISNLKTINGSGTGAFISSITGLTPGTKYFVRAYATNSAGTKYGENIEFTTYENITIPSVTTVLYPMSITSTTATSGGDVTSDGGASVTARGVCWNTFMYPTIENSKTVDGSGTGSYMSFLTGLLPNTTYFIRAYAINSVGIAYGTPQYQITTPTNLPTLTTSSVSSITSSTASCGGNISSEGASPVASRGVCWNTSSNPTISNQKTINGSGPGSFTSSITGLSPGTTYFVRAYATNSAGTEYGNQQTFTSDSDKPTLTTSSVSSITANTATCGGNISSDGGSFVTARGVCWSTSSNPTISNSRTTNGSGTGSFTSSITGLSSSTTYYIRAYATNSKGTEYGAEKSFTTKISDIDGNVYDVVTIGSQIWMKENLKTTRYNNGNPIGTTNPSNLNLTTYINPKYQWAYNGNESYVSSYGRLYTWYAATDGRGICPTGWRLPTDSDWTVLITFLGGENIAGGKLKQSGTMNWQSPNTGATNNSGFTALPGGQRNYNGSFSDIETDGVWWSSSDYNTTNAIGRNMSCNWADVGKHYFIKSNGFSVRCVK